MKAERCAGRTVWPLWPVDEFVQAHLCTQRLFLRVWHRELLAYIETREWVQQTPGRLLTVQRPLLMNTCAVETERSILETTLDRMRADA